MFTILNSKKDKLFFIEDGSVISLFRNENDDIHIEKNLISIGIENSRFNKSSNDDLLNEKDTVFGTYFYEKGKDIFESMTDAVEKGEKIYRMPKSDL